MAEAPPRAGAIAPGATLGILGGGQLARMLAMAGARLGLKSHVYAPDPQSPAFDVCALSTVAAYEDEAALAAFADSVALVTYEFENVPARSASLLAEHCLVRPGAEALAASQDRLVEKEFLSGLGIATAPFMSVEDESGLARAVAQLGRPSVLKTRRFGYDGKGQALLHDGSDLADAFRSLGGAQAILEGFIAFEKEISVIAARTPDGGFAAYDVCENVHEHHILSVSVAPAAVAPATAEAAVAITRRIAEALDYVGVIAVEMFVTREDGQERLRVNEIAPRVHNSGHWTLDGAATSQFEQHMRAICGWPLGATGRIGGAVEMRNLIGEAAAAWAQILADPDAKLHLYGKAEMRAGRKMGHVTRVTGHSAAKTAAPTLDKAR